MKKPSSPSSATSRDRRKFMINTAKTAGGLALLGIKPAFGKHHDDHVNKQYTVQDVMDLIFKEGNLSPIKDTVDTLKSGNASQPVTGIVTTMFATIPVIEEAVKRKANFIIAHEPTFYNHRDDTEMVPNNAVVKQKQELLDKHKIVVWRFHDYCHSIRPDTISYGVAKKANWLSYYKTGQNTLTIPPVSLQALVKHLKSSLGIAHVRVIGNPEQSCERLALMPGASGGKSHISVVEAQKPDVLIVGEVSEWETAEYIRDGKSFGKKTALIVLGHAQSEEPGMEWFVDWLQPKIKDVKVSHIASGNPFTWM